MCVADTQANYALETSWTGDAIRVTNRCRKADGSVEIAVGVAKIMPDSNNAKLKVAFFRPFYGNYWVLALGQSQGQYDWVLVGEPKREFAWVLSRQAILSADNLNQAMKIAQQLGYKREQFVTTPHNQTIQ